MAIWGFFGSLGNGKDTTANYFFSLPKYRNRKIISHTQLNFPYIHMPIEKIFDTAVSNTQFFKDKILYISEFHLIMESRRSTASVNVEFSQNILIQLGKLDCDLFYTAQLLSQIDLRIKQMQKYFFFCTKKFRLDGLSIQEYENLDFDKRIVIHPVTKKPLPFDIYLDIVGQDGEKLQSSQAILPWEIIITLFDRFDTREIIQFDRKKYLKS